MDVRDELEAAIGHGPVLPDPADRLAAGRRALRRRRVLVGAGAVVVMAAIVVPVATLAGGDATRGLAPAPAAPPASSAPTVTSPSTTPEPPPRWLRGDLVRYLPDGTLEIRPGATVIDRVDDYLAAAPRIDRSVALELRFRGVVHWVTVERFEDGSSGTGTTRASDGWADFRSYVADQAAANTGGEGVSGYPELVQVDEGGSLAAAPGARIIEQRIDLGLPESFAPAGASTAAAYVEQDGVRYLVLYRDTGGTDFVTVESAGHGDTLDELLTWARERYESGAGLL